MRRTTEDYLKFIYLVHGEKGVVHSVDLAEKLGVSKATVCVQLKNLTRDGFAVMNSDHEISLTDQGIRVAVSVIDRNVTLCGLLEDLGVDPQIAEQDACQMEHVISAVSLAALKKFRRRRLKPKHL